jgi:predicted  nucleic acid-binding Zn-ribbon protein
MNPDDILDKKNDSGRSAPQSVRDSLVAEINALQHELRRVKDALERVGGSSHDLEKKARQLSKNIQLSENDLKKQRGN